MNLTNLSYWERLLHRQLELDEDTGPLAFRKLPAPKPFRREIPLSPRAAHLVEKTQAAIADMIHGRDRHRWLIIVGPCSVWDPEEALEYGRRLEKLAHRLQDDLLLVMRVYLEKPRSGLGWKGFLTDPYLDGKGNVLAGLRFGRRLLTELNEMGIPSATELLDPFFAPYLQDCLSWAAVGARTSESQVHRQMVSSLSIPVGFKNNTQGSIDAAVNAVAAAQKPHRLVGLNDWGYASEAVSRGNPNVHVVLRGGQHGSNYGPADVEKTERLLADSGLARPILVDCSHDNSRKDHTRQAAVGLAVLEQLLQGRRSFVGLSFESNLREGKQAWSVGQKPAYGISITDACIGWEETENLLTRVALTISRSKTQ